MAASKNLQASQVRLYQVIFIGVCDHIHRLECFLWWCITILNLWYRPLEGWSWSNVVKLLLAMTQYTDTSLYVIHIKLSYHCHFTYTKKFLSTYHIWLSLFLPILFTATRPLSVFTFSFFSLAIPVPFFSFQHATSWKLSDGGLLTLRAGPLSQERLSILQPLYWDVPVSPSTKKDNPFMHNMPEQTLLEHNSIWLKNMCNWTLLPVQNSYLHHVHFKTTNTGCHWVVYLFTAAYELHLLVIYCPNITGAKCTWRGIQCFCIVAREEWWLPHEQFSKLQTPDRSIKLASMRIWNA